MSDKAFKLFAIIASCGLALVLAFFMPSISFANEGFAFSAHLEGTPTIIQQDVTEIANDAHKITKIYDGDQLIGIIQDQTKIETLLTEVYTQRYQDEFPSSKMNLDTDVYMTEEDSYFVYEDKDEEILKYIDENELFSFEVTRIEFSNGAVIYVKDETHFEEAKRQYLLNFIDEDALKLISVNQLPPELTTYGERDIGIQVIETINISKGYASLEDILTSVKDIIYFLSYGYGTELNSYQTVEYDTVEGVASKVGLTSQQLITLNSDILKTDTQLLKVGTELNVTFFNSPINVVVTKERAAKEIVYPEATRYVANPEIREGMNNVIVKEENGSKNVYYKEIYINGVMAEYEVLNEETTLEPIQEVVEYGTKIIPGVGSGSFRYPVNNAKITCHWYCYAGHTAIDVVNTYERYGAVKAADRGTIDETGYNRINGYYVWIDHNNGYRTYYGHMNRPCYFSEGVNVEKGETIGQIGETGKATGPHTHFVIEYQGTRYNPCRWLGC